MADSPSIGLRRSREPLGYWLRGTFHAGFQDDETLPLGARRRIAAWARAHTPEDLSSEQRRVLAAPFDGQDSPARLEAERLGSFENSP